MTDNFPDLSSKLGAPAKKSFFERQKAEAEAKRAKAEAETAAVYQDFVKSFDDEDDNDRRDSAPSREHGAGRPSASGTGFAAGGLGKRHFTSTGLKSGPGSLGPSPNAPRSGPGSLGPPTHAFGRKRPYDDFQSGRRDRERDRGQGMFSYEDDRPAASSRDSADAASAFRADDDEDQKGSNEAKIAAKPTLHLSSLPPGTSPAVIKALIPLLLSVENVRIIPPMTPSSHHVSSTSTERKSTSAIVTLAAETPATDIDTIVSQLQNRYLGFGFNLSISRHLSSAALSGPSAITAPSSSSLTNQPFNARPVIQHTSLSRAPPPGQSQSRFAPPASFTSSTPYSARNSTPATQVIVQPPTDLAQLKLIHKTLEALLTHGPEFEALLMSRPAIQSDEKWAWLWNARSVGGVYYRWRLWDILTDGENRRRNRRSYGVGGGTGGEEVFARSAPWVPPEQNLKFEYTTKMEEFVEAEEYDSSDEEDGYDKSNNMAGGGLAGRYNDHNNLTSGPPADVDIGTDGVGYLNPLAKAKLVHLLARLPDGNAKLRKGDVARVTAFAIEHAGAGAAEVVEMCCWNVVRPLCHLGANKERKSGSSGDDEEGRSDGKEKEKGKVDMTSASMVGLYVISDILSSSSTSGVRHAWRYRSLFEAALKKQKVFETLGRVDKELGWGRLKAEKWKRSVQSVLSLWEGWCVFPQASHEAFVEGFLSPPLSDGENAAMEREEAQRKEKEQEELRRSKSNSKWRSVEDGGDGKLEVGAVGDDEVMVDVGYLDGEEMIDEDDEDDLAMSDIDGVPMEDSSDEETQQAVESAGQQESRDSGAKDVGVQQQQKSPPMKRQRPRAVDMFADDSGGED